MAIGGVPVLVETDTPAAAGRIGDWIAQALVTADVLPGSGPPLRLRVLLGASPAEPPVGAQEMAAAPAWRVWRDGERAFLRFTQASGALDLVAGRAELRLAAGWWQESMKDQQAPWVLALVWLLRERGRYALHASVVARRGLGLMIAGESGRGKSSTALSLIHQGWTPLADDVVILEPGEVPWLHALARGFTFSPALAERLPGLIGTAAGHKHFAVDGLPMAGPPVTTCQPGALLFPRVVNAEHSRLEPLSTAAALLTLLPASAGLLAGGALRQAQAQMSALRELVGRTPAWRLAAGRDIFGNGAALAALLLAQGVWST